MSRRRIENLKHHMTHINLIVQIIEKGRIKITETKFGKKTICECVVKDETGEALLLLWKEDIDKVEVNNIIEIKNGYCRFRRRKPQLRIGKIGKLLIKKSKNDDFKILRSGLSQEEQAILNEQARIRRKELIKQRDKSLRKLKENMSPEEKEEAIKAKKEREKKERFLRDLHDSV